MGSCISVQKDPGSATKLPSPMKSKNEKEFWNWSWDELAFHDLPSVIDFVSKQTGQQIHYAGHSMGTLIAIASLSEDKFRNVKSAALLSPVAYNYNVTSPVLIAGAKSFIGEIGQTFGISEFDPNGAEAIRYLVETICSLNNVKCDDLMTKLTGKNCCLNETIVKDFLEDDLQPSSTKNMVHFSHGVRSGVVSKYDYGVGGNLLNYDSTQPPLYESYFLARLSWVSLISDSLNKSDMIKYE
ncbi:hypothetical protein OROGR_010901 [Orobanche gracilis]